MKLLNQRGLHKPLVCKVPELSELDDPPYGHYAIHAAIKVKHLKHSFLKTYNVFLNNNYQNSMFKKYSWKISNEWNTILSDWQALGSHLMIKWTLNLVNMNIL